MKNGGCYKIPNLINHLKDIGEYEGIDCRYCEENRATPLMMACKRGDLDVVYLSFDFEADFNLVDTSGRTPLIYASAHGHGKVAKRILENRDVDIDHQDADGMTALMYASAHNYVKVAKILRERGAKVNLTDKSGMTAMMYAAKFNNLKIVHELLQPRDCPDFEEVDLGIKDNRGWDALAYAVRGGNARLVLKMILAGADMESDLGDGDTVRDLATSECRQLFIGHATNEDLKKTLRKQKKISYNKLVVLAVGSLSPGNRRPASRQSIKKWIDVNYFVKTICAPSDKTVNSYIRKALKKNIEKGYIKQIKQSFKLTPEGRKYYKTLKQ